MSSSARAGWQSGGRGRGRGRPWRARGQGSTVSRATSPRGRGDFDSGPRRPPFRGADGGRPRGAIFMQDRPPSGVDARIRDDSDKAVVANLSAGGTATSAAADADPRQGLPLRPNFGTQGRQIALRANYFPVTVQGQIFQYSAEIVLPRGQNKNISRRVKQRVFRLAEACEDWAQAGLLGRVAHDSAEKLVASFLLPQPLTIRGAYYDEGDDAPAKGGSEYALTLTFVGEVDKGILNECLAGTPVDSQALAKVLSALNLVLTTHASHTGIKIGRDDETKKHPDQRLFFDNPAPRDIGGGLTAREGFYVSVRPAHQQLMINVNTCHAAFYKPQNFIAAMQEYQRFGGGDTSAFGSQVRVVTRPNNHTAMIKGVSKQNANEHKFKHNDYGLVTIAKYYELKHGIKLNRPDLPLLEAVNGSLFPPEVCDIPKDQGFKGELTHKKHAANMLDVACKPPNENADKIVNGGLNRLGFQGPNPVLDAFGVDVGNEMAVVPGRILNNPGLSYSSNQSPDIDSMRASWNLRGVTFAVGAQLKKWAVLVIQDGGDDDFGGSQDPLLRRVARDFGIMCNKSGMQVSPLGEQAYAEVRLPPARDRFRDNAIAEMERVLRKLMAQAEPDLVLVMLSDDDKAIYNGLKQLCDVKLDVATVSMRTPQLKKSIQNNQQQQYYANVALKVNMKMGGINHTLDANSGTWLKRASTMVMGMDVTHPTGGGSVDGAPSVVAVVASIDGHFARYPVALAIRRGKIEIERNGDPDLMDMFVSRFKLYKDHNKGKLPECVILYRDGVSESQFAQVRVHELKVIREAIKSFGMAYRPKLSIIVCGKRHNTRFYPTRGQDAARDGNPLPGTVVDRGVTPVYDFDFFLQPHASLKGTARPTHYYVVHDENGFTADELQGVTNDLSYMFARATKAVSLVSPAYWADVACERGRCYLYKLLAGKEGGEAKTGDNNKGKGRGKGRGKQQAEETVFEQAQKMWGSGVSGKNLRDTMFYL